MGEARKGRQGTDEGPQWEFEASGFERKGKGS